MFQCGGLGALFGGAKPSKAPRGDGTDPRQRTLQVSGNHCNMLMFLVLTSCHV